MCWKAIVYLVSAVNLNPLNNKLASILTPSVFIVISVTIYFV